MGYIFEWDPKKAKAMSESTAWSSTRHQRCSGEPVALLMPDPDHSLGEKRYVVLGLSNQERLLVVAFAERPPRTRLISARRATRGERRRYEDQN